MFTISTRLRRLALYACLDLTSLDTQDQVIALLFRAGEPEAYPAGATVFSAGEPGDRMYVVKSGSVVLNAADGRALETVEAGDIFGEMALIDREPRSASAQAGTDCELVSIDKRRFWFLVQETPYFAQVVMRAMAERLRRRT
jgi:CRP/FNR family transcriptional regulator, cyclic AMP receptor protein